MPILLVTNRRDITTDYLIRELARRNIPFVRLNTDTLIEKSVILDPVQQKMEIRGQNSLVCIENVSAAYFRRPSTPVVDPALGMYRDYVWTEWNTFLKMLYSIVGERWFSHPHAILLAEDKARQLRLAYEIGFKVPETIVTNDPDAVREIQNDFTLVAKPMKQALIDDGDNGLVIFTSRANELSQDDFASIAVCPAIFQRFIPKDVDLRVTVVGSKVFSVAIHSQDTEETKTDWRRGSNPNLCHEIITLPPDIAEKCVEMVHRQNLRFGAIDLVQDKDGDIWFLECNPNGQWAWIENRTGLPIAEAITDDILDMVKQC